MSSVISRKKTVVLFTPGLGQSARFYEPTVNKLVDNSTKMVQYDGKIDMQDFDSEINFFRGLNNQGYFTRSTQKYLEFNGKISDIVALATSRPNKVILVKLDLQKYPHLESNTVKYKYYDSINNQATKLCYIIDAIKAMDRSIEIILVGHSQGGLVNLETAIRKSSKIKKMVSISTPYRSVWAADLLALPIIINRIFDKLTGYNAIDEIEKAINQGLDDVNYQNRILDLSSDPYFIGLHSRWNNLENRPPLTVITGTSGHLITRDAGIIRTKQSFDGLVKTSEQKGISHARFVNLSNTSVPCYILKTIFNDTCHDSVLSPCRYLCPLPNFGLGDALFRTSLRVLDKAIKNGNFNFLGEINDEKDISVVNAINAGLEKKSDFNDSLFQNYYDIYASDYSHFYLPQCDETIGKLLSEFEN